jgi:hypothetical protein
MNKTRLSSCPLPISREAGEGQLLNRLNNVIY